MARSKAQVRTFASENALPEVRKIDTIDRCAACGITLSTGDKYWFVPWKPPTCLHCGTVRDVTIVTCLGCGIPVALRPIEHDPMSRWARCRPCRGLARKLSP